MISIAISKHEKYLALPNWSKIVDMSGVGKASPTVISLILPKSTTTQYFCIPDAPVFFRSLELLIMERSIGCH